MQFNWMGIIFSSNIIMNVWMDHFSSVAGDNEFPIFLSFGSSLIHVRKKRQTNEKGEGYGLETGSKNEKANI